MLFFNALLFSSMIMGSFVAARDTPLAAAWKKAGDSVMQLSNIAAQVAKAGSSTTVAQINEVRKSCEDLGEATAAVALSSQDGVIDILKFVVAFDQGFILAAVELLSAEPSIGFVGVEYVHSVGQSITSMGQATQNMFGVVIKQAPIVVQPALNLYAGRVANSISALLAAYNQA